MPLDLATSKIPKYVPSIAANVTKRMLERGYDGVFKTRFGQWLVNLSPWKKHSLEAVLYVITAVLDERLPEDSFFRKYAKQVGSDAAPEISKRMINGAMDDIANAVSTATTPEESEFLSIILSLDDGDIADLIRWFGQTDLERKSVFHQLSRLSPEQSSKFFRLSDENRRKLMEFFESKEKAEKDQEPAGPSFGQVFRQDLTKGAEHLRTIKERMREQRKGGMR